jgi:molybdopterin/thiamine biosynthesis adenylyltransferase
MNDQELLRYSRHILLDEIGIEGQNKLLQSHVLIIGAGGLGSACAPYIAAAGVGTITIVDHDIVDLTNLQRQIMHEATSVGEPKVNSAASMLGRLNPNTKIIPIQKRADQTLLDELVASVDVVIDCTDNFKTRHAINLACVQAKKPLVFGAAIQLDGQASVFDVNHDQSPCYACIFPEDQAFEEVRCATMGVFSPLVGIIGTLQAAQALQIIVGFEEPLIGRLALWDGRRSEMTQIKIKRKIDCPVCASAH